MKKTLCVLLVLMVSVAAFAQKKVYTFEDDVLAVDGVPVFKLEKQKSQSYYGYNDLILNSLDGKKLAFMRFEQFADPKAVGGKTSYYEVTFLNTGAKTETLWFVKVSKMAENLAKGELVKDNALDDEKVDEYVLINGNQFSRRRQELNPNTVIINNNPPANTQPNKGGVNININTP